MKKTLFRLLLPASLMTLATALEAQTCGSQSLAGTYMAACAGTMDLHRLLPTVPANSFVPYAAVMRVAVADPVSGTATVDANIAGIALKLVSTSVTAKTGDDCNGTVTIAGTMAGAPITDAHKLVVTPEGKKASSILTGPAVVLCDWIRIKLPWQ
jgi:hypothetical protein